MTPGQAIKIVSDVFETAEADVETFDRRLQEAGLRTSTGGRGSSAPHVSEEDVIRLMLATLIVKRPARTAATVSEWWGFTSVGNKLKRSEKASLPPQLSAAIDDATLGEALAALLADCVQSDDLDFLIELLPQMKEVRIAIGDDKKEAVLVFKGGFNIGEPRSRFLTKHEIYPSAFVAIAEALRG